ncbi:MAG: hypothetical protein EZS28_024444 [Streblomastix strix]|uniref:Uncharacterized protein n=1 Tax=Streblomastix strix TaxID=222440 RepID=A0A5J4VBX4_9EUKA|nr:MAG: hypothetical protein EZS28_024444 [Streblomastix strix]
MKRGQLKFICTRRELTRLLQPRCNGVKLDMFLHHKNDAVTYMILGQVQNPVASSGFLPEPEDLQVKTSFIEYIH